MHNNSEILIDKCSLPDKEYLKTYTVEIKQIITSMDDVNKNVINIDLDKKFIKKDDFGYLFSINVKSRKQSSLLPFREMEDFLSIIFNKIILYTDDNGYIKSIVNSKEISEHWDDIRKTFQKKFRKIEDINNIIERLNDIINSNEKLLHLFIESEIGTLLFPPIYFPLLSPDIQIRQRKIFDNFFGPYPLLMEMRTELDNKKDIEDYKTISRIGSLDEKVFEQDKVKLYFRRLYEKYNLSTDIQLTYGEIYKFTDTNIIKSAFQVFGVEVGECYSFDQIVNITLQ